MTHFRMNGAALRGGRERLGLTLQNLADALGMSIGGAQELADMEAGRRSIPGPVALATQALFDGWRPPHLRARAPLQIAA